MKKSELRQLIREELSNPDAAFWNGASYIKDLEKAKSDLKAIDKDLDNALKIVKANTDLRGGVSTFIKISKAVEKFLIFTDVLRRRVVMHDMRPGK